MRFDPSNRSLKFWKSTGTPSPNLGVALGVALGVWRLTPSHSPTLSGVSDVTPGLPLGPHPCNPFALVASPKLGLRHPPFKHLPKKSFDATIQNVEKCLEPGLPMSSYSCETALKILFLSIQRIWQLCVQRVAYKMRDTSWHECYPDYRSFLCSNFCYSWTLAMTIRSHSSLHRLIFEAATYPAFLGLKWYFLHAPFLWWSWQLLCIICQIAREPRVVLQSLVFVRHYQ